MLKFTLATRHPDGGSRERFFYEWSILHVSLMLTTPTVFKVFKRYVQHFAVPRAAHYALVYPLSPEGWENFADHLVEKYEDVVESVHASDYVQRMQPHRFSSDRFITGLSTPETVYQEDGFRSGGVKLIHFLKTRDGVSQEEFNNWFRERRAPAMRESVCSLKAVRKYVQDAAVDLDPAIFKGTLFELGSIGLYAGMEEIWFDSATSVSTLRRNEEVYESICDSETGIVDAKGSISMVVKERVVYDSVTPGEMTPKPAVLDPNSLEAAIDRQGYGGFDIPD